MAKFRALVVRKSVEYAEVIVEADNEFLAEEEIQHMIDCRKIEYTNDPSKDVEEYIHHLGVFDDE